MAVPYKIAIAIAMNSNHNAVLSALSAGLLGIHTKVNQLQGSFNRLKLAVGGALAVTGGLAMLGVMEKLIEKTKDYSHELAKLENLGGDMKNAVLSGGIEKQAFDISKRVPMNPVELMKIPAMTYSMLGQKESEQHWEEFAKLSIVMQAQKDYKGDPKNDIQTLIKAGEISGRIQDDTGKIDDKKLTEFLDTSTRLINATHGMINPQSIYALAQQGGSVALRPLSEQGFYDANIVAQAMGGHRTGTAMISQWSQLAGGKMSPATAKAMTEQGLLGQDEWKTSKGGGVLVDEAARKRLTAMIGNSPLDMAAHLVEDFKKKGITDKAEQARLIMGMFGRQTTQRLNAEEVANFHNIIEERGRVMQGASGEGAFQTLMNKDVELNMKAMKAAWEGLLYAIAGPNSGVVVEILQKITGAFHYMTDAVRGMNPETLRSIGLGLAALAVGLTAAGTVAILAALGPIGLLIGGIAALAVVLADPKNDVGKMFYSLASNMLDWVKQGYANFEPWFKSNSIADALIRWVQEGYDANKVWLQSNSIADALTTWLSSSLAPAKAWLESNSISEAVTAWAQGSYEKLSAWIASTDLFQSLKSALSGFVEWLTSLAGKIGGLLPSLLPENGKTAPEIRKDMYERKGGFFGGGKVIPQSFEPGQQKLTAQPIQISMNLDGRSLGQAVSEQLMYLATFSGSAPSANGRSAFVGGDNNRSAV